MPRTTLRAALLPLLASVVILWGCAWATLPPASPSNPAARTSAQFVLSPSPQGALTPTANTSLLLWRDESAGRVTVKAGPSPTPAPSPTPTPPPLPGQGPEMPGTFVTRTARLDFYLGRDSFSRDQVLALTTQIEAALNDTEALFGTKIRDRTSIAFYRIDYPSSGGARALCFSEERRIQLFYGSWEETARAVPIAAHELAHQLQADRYGDEVQRRADIILHEGLATWLAGKHWLDLRDASSWRERGQRLMKQGRLLSLLRDPSGAAANDAYDGWASFVDYLLTTYGWPAFDDLYRSSKGRYTGSADYKLVYGKSLDELADEWRAWLRQELR